jgi:3-hydroxyacyl-[acyl-carrier-protein] dehydratase
MESIEQLIPHRPPFLFVDEIVAVGTDTITTRRRVRPEEDFFKGHYPGNPIMPGVLLCESVFQSGCAMVSRQMAATKDDLARYTPVLARITDVRFKSIVKPGDELIIDVKLKERLGRFLFLSGSVRTADNRRVLTVNFGVALLDKEAPTTAAGADPAQPAP